MFVVFEGIDGSGKTALSKGYAEHLNRMGCDTLWTCEPTHEGEYGSAIRAMLTGKEPAVGPQEMAMLFALDRLDHLERVVRPALKAGRSVVCDRYVYSNIAYQSATFEGTVEERRRFATWVRTLNHYANAPDFIVMLTVADEVARQRILARGTPPELFELQTEVRSKISDIYKSLQGDPFSSHHGEVVIDTSNATYEESLETLINALAHHSGFKP